LLYLLFSLVFLKNVNFALCYLLYVHINDLFKNNIWENFQNILKEYIQWLVWNKVSLSLVLKLFENKSES
jgi:hypothetical protein